MRSITLGVAVMLALLGAGCSRGQGKPPAEGTIFTVVVSKDAASAANQDGGLADHFATEAFPETPAQPWDHALTSSQERSLWLDARRILNVPFGYDHPSWFFGAGNMPRWAGYTLGYDMVGRYLDHRRSASDAVAVDATDVIESFRGP